MQGGGHVRAKDAATSPGRMDVALPAHSLILDVQLPEH